MTSILSLIAKVDGMADAAVKKDFGVAKSAVLKVLEKLYTDEKEDASTKTRRGPVGRKPRAAKGEKVAKGKPGRKPGRKPKAAAEKPEKRTVKVKIARPRSAKVPGMETSSTF
jgi:hypothetical protein